MTDLPTVPVPTGQSSSPPPPADQPAGQGKPAAPAQPISVSGGNKEIVGGSLTPSETILKAVGQEVELPKEVAEAGVKVEKTSVELPPEVQRLGVQPVGQAVPVQNVQAQAVPLSDQQIADGLKQGVETSWRWLAEWCTRRLLQMHRSVKAVHGRIVSGH